MRITILAIVAGLLLGGCTTRPPDTTGMPLTLDPAVQQSVALALRDYRPPAKSVRLVAHRVTMTSGETGGVASLRLIGEYGLRDGGLWGVAGSSLANQGRTSSVSQALTLCGLATLVDSSEATSTMAMLGSRYRRGIFYGRSVSSTQHGNRQLRAIAFDAPPGICTPQPGQRFTYRLTTTIDITTSGPSAALSTDATAEVTCQTAAATQPARQLGVALMSVALPDEALLTRCEQSGADGVERRDYAYLRAAGLYLLIREEVPEHKATVSYNAVNFGPG